MMAVNCCIRLWFAANWTPHDGISARLCVCVCVCVHRQEILLLQSQFNFKGWPIIPERERCF